MLSEQEHSPLGRLRSLRQDPTALRRRHRARAQLSRHPPWGMRSSSSPSVRRAGTARPGPAGTGLRPSARRRPSAARPPAAWARSSACGRPRRAWAASDRMQRCACGTSGAVDPALLTRVFRRSLHVVASASCDQTHG